MAKTKTSKRQQRATRTLLEKSVTTIALGFVLLIGSRYMGSSPMIKPLMFAARSSGWIALGLGLVMLGLHFALKRKTEQTSNSASIVPKRRETTNRHKDFGKARSPFPGGVDLEARHAPFANPVTTRQPATAWSSAVFAAIEWRRFEAVCEALFAQAGFTTKSQSHGADGGVDIWLYSVNSTGPAAVAQCKHWTSQQVGVKEVREFFGVMASHQLKRGTYATSSTYTADALQFAKVNGINAMDGAALLRQIATRTPEQQRALLAVAFEGEYWRPTCASCGIKLLERTPAKGGSAFWGCSNYPRCKTRMAMSAALQ